MMAAVLDLLSQGKIDLTLRNKARWMRERCIMKVYPSRKLTNKYSALVQKIDIQIRKKPSFVSNKIAFSPSSIQYNGKMHTSDYNQIDEHIKTLDREHNGISQVYQAIKSQGKSGVLSTRLTKLIQKTKGIQMDEDKVIKYCDILISHHPPLIQMVGFNQLRYVSYQYLKHWYLKSNQENSYFEPVIWNDYNGNIIPEALRGCADTVISYIVQSPGISLLSSRRCPRFLSR
ncbi:hypothetical protein BDB01DRAFT_549890 [Pilobolus umbonatus]|nr:hypothetical protein BDB01DRAFT_549890 [Pilobolus umbonatus]